MLTVERQSRMCLVNILGVTAVPAPATKKRESHIAHPDHRLRLETIPALKSGIVP